VFVLAAFAAGDALPFVVRRLDRLATALTAGHAPWRLT
jgi:hypothetical protein